MSSGLSNVQVVVLAGGLGTRLRPLTETVPKPLVEVNGRPFLDWQLESLRASGFRRVLLLTAYLGEMIEAHFKDGQDLGLEVQCCREPEPLGTGGALQHASKLLEDHFFLINGDSFLDCPYDQMWTAFCTLSKGCDAMVSAFARLSEVPVPGNLKLAKESGEQDQPVRRVTAYQANGGLERGYTSVDSGVYIIKSTALQTVWSEGSWPLSRLWAQLINKETFWSFEHENRFFDIGTPERLAEFGNHLKGKKS